LGATGHLRRSGNDSGLETGAVWRLVSTAAGWKETGGSETIELECDSGRIVIEDLKGGSLLMETAGGITRESTGGLPSIHWGQVENFAKHLVSGGRLACDGREGRRSAVVLDFISILSEN